MEEGNLEVLDEKCRKYLDFGRWGITGLGSVLKNEQFFKFQWGGRTVLCPCFLVRYLSDEMYHVNYCQ
jgi:hypothetical protein